MTSRAYSVDGDTVSGLVAHDVPRVAPSTSTREALAALRGRAFECSTDLAVLDGERLIGLVSLEALVASDPELPVRELADPSFVAVPEDLDGERAAAQAAQRGARTVAVVGRDGRFEGLVPAARLTRVLFEAHEEDLARLGGSLARSAQALEASVEAVPRRLWHRIPWLVLGLAGAMLSTGVVASFETELRDEVLLAFFLPAVVYMADAVGTQTEAVVIRGMSLGVPIGRIAARELLTGLVIGVLIAAQLPRLRSRAVGGARCRARRVPRAARQHALATAVAMALPYLLARFGRDPAFGSGPLATVVQDLLSIVAYFTIAVAIL